MNATMNATAVEATRPRTYEVRTFGCQMNVHDSERLSGTLDAAGFSAIVDAADRGGR